MRHPAKYSDTLLPHFARLLDGYTRILDPFAGTGKLRLVRPDAELLEIEPEWAAIRNATVGSALDMPWPDDEFDAICTSPAYGNRMADKFLDDADKYHRNTYANALERNLHPENGAAYQWGDAYRALHRQAWQECWRVLRPGGRFILNIKDHIRAGQRVPVTAWHIYTLLATGFQFRQLLRVPTPGQRYGANGQQRVPYEYIVVFVAEKTPCTTLTDPAITFSSAPKSVPLTSAISTPFWVAEKSR